GDRADVDWHRAAGGREAPVANSAVSVLPPTAHGAALVAQASVRGADLELDDPVVLAAFGGLARARGGLAVVRLAPAIHGLARVGAGPRAGSREPDQPRHIRDHRGSLVAVGGA